MPMDKMCNAFAKFDDVVFLWELIHDIAVNQSDCFMNVALA